MTTKEFKQEYHTFTDKYDKWGECMDALFEVAAHLFYRGAEIPNHWQYSPGLGGDPKEEENYWYELFEETDSETLTEIGNILERYSQILDGKGLSY